MLPKVVLVLLQASIGYLATPWIRRYLPGFGAADIFVIAVALAVLVWLIGVLGSVVLKDVATPSPAVLTSALIVALILAAVTLVPPVTAAIGSAVKGIPLTVYPLIGAIAGYFVRR
jgi:hypothetical protein